MYCDGRAVPRVSSKQTKQKFGPNRNKPKQDLFWLCFGLFCETKNKNFGLLRCPQNKQNKNSVLTKTNQNKICFGCVTVCFVKPKTKNFGLFRLLRCFEPI